MDPWQLREWGPLLRGLSVIVFLGIGVHRVLKARRARRRTTSLLSKKPRPPSADK